MQVVDIILQHTPTFIEVQTMKAKLLKKMGNVKEALEKVEEARKMDLNDRWLNNNSVKMHLKCNKLAKAHKIVSEIMPNHDMN